MKSGLMGRNPTTGMAGCACAASGQVAAAPPSSPMNWRRLLRKSIQKTPVQSMIAVSWIRVRSAHGNSFDHLVGDGE
jgi:hypothetical protein